MTKQQVEQAAETHADKYSDDPHAIAKESFIEGVSWFIKNIDNSDLSLIFNAIELSEIHHEYLNND